MKLKLKKDAYLDLMRRLWSQLNPRRKSQFTVLLVLMILAALAEVASLGAVLPFMSALVAPEKVFKYPFVREAADLLGVHSGSEMAVPLTVLFSLIAISSGAIRMLQLWVGSRITFSVGTELSIEVYRRTLYQPYITHLQRNSGDIISGVTNKVEIIVSGVLMTTLTLISSIFLFSFVIVTLIAINPMVALISMFGFGFSYGAISWIVKERLKKNSALIALEHTKVIKALQEGLGGIRDVLLDGTQSTYCNIYFQADSKFRRAQGNNAFISGSPRFVVESIGMILIATMALVLSRKPGGVTDALPVLGALALGAQRLLPTLQNIYSGWASIAGTHSSFVEVVKTLEQPIEMEFLSANQTAMAFKDKINFNDVSFQYSKDGPVVLDHLNFSIKKGSRIGFVGSTGSGKSTTSDILMGLLSPTRGHLSIDETKVSSENVRNWQKIIAHVPQSIYLSDSTILENIAFGLEPKLIDISKVKIAAEKAQLLDFIENQRDGFNTFVGERGIRLSGGQRQRIGIARAIYKQAQILVLDEATSALDNTTEEAVMNSIENLARELTIVVIAHRLTTIQNCDVIYELENGKIIAQGTYEQLTKISPTFQKMSKNPLKQTQ